MSKDNIGFGGAGLNNPQPQPDIDKILDDIFEMGVNHGKGLWNDYPALKPGIKKSIYSLLASEAEQNQACWCGRSKYLCGHAPKSNVGDKFDG